MTGRDLAFLIPLYRRPCLLCGGRQYITGVWVPSNQARVHAPPGKLRTCLYSLCKKCKRKPGTIAAVEARLIAEATAKAGVN